MKNDLVSRQAATTIPILPKEHRQYQTMNIDDAYDLGWFDCQNCIEKLPPEQPEIIRCEKCEHYTALTGICEVRGKGLILIRRPDDFCSRGARREE